jgi:hypothetical protein
MRGNVVRMNTYGRSYRPRRALSGYRAGFASLTAVLAATAALLVPAGAGAAVVRPTVYTGGVSALTPTSAILHGSFNAHGLPTNFVFQYGFTAGFSSQTPLTPGGNRTTNLAVALAITGLRPATKYHYRILATNGSGNVVGAVRFFTTPKVPLSLQTVGAPNPVPFGAPFAVQGALVGTDAGPGRGVALQLNPFPYTAGFTTFGNRELTGAGGAFSFPVVGLSTNTEVRVVTTSPPYIASPIMVEGVSVQVTFHLHRVHRAHRGRFYRMYGTVTPGEPGAGVGLQLLRSGAPSTNVGGTVITSGNSSVSHYSTVVRIRHGGVYEVLVRVVSGAQVSAYSEGIRIR